MLRRLSACAVLSASLLAGGCGTVCNLVKPDGEKTYGGVRFDVEQIDRLTSGESSSGPLSSSGAGGGSVAAVVLLVGPFLDIPLSFLADTLTFPLARWLDSRR